MGFGPKYQLNSHYYLESEMGPINSFKNLHQWGANIQTTCLFCDSEEETITYEGRLFF